MKNIINKLKCWAGMKPKKVTLPPNYGKRARENRQMHLQIAAAKRINNEALVESQLNIEEEVKDNNVLEVKNDIQALNQMTSQLQHNIEMLLNEQKGATTQIQNDIKIMKKGLSEASAQVQGSIDGLSKGLKKDNNGVEATQEGIRFLCELYTTNALRQIDVGDSPEINAVQKQILTYLRMRDVAAVSSAVGTHFDPKKMQVAKCNKPYITTSRKDDDNTVAITVAPAFRIGNADGGLLQYEQVALYRYDENAVVTTEPCSTPPQGPIQEKVIGYLLMKQYGNITAVYEVYEGRNVFGTHPRAIEDGHSQSIPINEGMEQEHFEICDDTARMLSGKWGIDSLNNDDENEVETYNGMCIILNEQLSFIYIDK